MLILASVMIVWPGKRRRGERGTWLFGERFDDARDNAFHLFAYVKKRYPHINARYLIVPGSKDYDKVAKLGGCVAPNSLEHYRLWLTSRFLISAHHGYLAPNWGGWGRLVPRRLKLKRSIMLQHGVTAIHMHTIQYARHYPHALVSTVAERERQLLINTGGHAPEVVKVLGFARFDALKDAGESKRQILLMPTWRRWLVAASGSHGSKEYAYAARKQFEISEYYHALCQLLHCPRLHQILSQNDYKLMFFLHPNLQLHLDSFNVCNSCIKMCSAEEYDVQELIKESALLVSDFSSVSFDFAFMRRPVIYYHFDVEKFFGGEHKNEQAFFDFREDGFGPQVFHAAEVVNEIQKLIETKNPPLMPLVYKKRAEEFFGFHDSYNRARTFERLQEMV